jgi:DNA-binding transcriptional ArsR family regulator
MERKKRSTRRKDAKTRGGRSSDPHAANADLVAALNHPTRRQLLKLYLEREAALSPRELADLTGEKLPTISYHVRVLSDRNAIELAEEEPVRGSVAHFYRPTDLIRGTPWVLESLELESPRR